jgi:glycosyltransferase involved in cell wall biosynthesis
MQQVSGSSHLTAVALNDMPQGYDYPAEVEFEINQNLIDDYRLAASYLNMNAFDAVCLQHEYGLFGGKDGSHIIRFIEQVNMPVVTVLHTVLKEPSFSQRQVLLDLAEGSDRIVVMSEVGRQLLLEIYGLDETVIELIPHGIPDTPFVDPSFHKDRFGVEDRRVILTFGLLSPNKGIEHVIRALPAVVEQHPDVAYIVLGATHPHVKKAQGEAYRLSLHQLARDLGVDGHVIFHNRYVDLNELCDFLGVADIYATPYLNEAQVVSGTLVYAMGSGKAVVSTPYWHAKEMLAAERGRIVPFCDPDAFARAFVEILGNRQERNAMRKRAYTYCRPSVWKEVGQRYLDLFGAIVARRQTEPRNVVEVLSLRGQTVTLPAIDLSHLYRMSDDTGILQHAAGAVPNRHHGYCTDDNARALVVSLLARTLVSPESGLAALANRFLAFLVHAFDSESGTFRNFLSYDRRWLEQEGSPDSHGRAVWALGTAVEHGDEGLREVAVHLMHACLARTERLTDLRAIAFSLLGLEALLQRFGGDTAAKRLRLILAERLLAAFETGVTDEWLWPEESITYANARLPHALLVSGRSMSRVEMVDRALSSLGWLSEMQFPEDHFVPIGNRGWFPRGGPKARFDQQPVEAGAMIAACAEALRVTEDLRWEQRASLCFRWFLGRNDLGVPVYDYSTGGCRDGLGPNSANDNQGAESTLAWLHASVQMHTLQAEGALRSPVVDKTLKASSESKLHEVGMSRSWR